jgi:hypothetical protein
MRETIENIGYKILKNLSNGYYIIELNNPFPFIDNFPDRHVENCKFFIHKIN